MVAARDMPGRDTAILDEGMRCDEAVVGRDDGGILSFTCFILSCGECNAQQVP